MQHLIATLGPIHDLLPPSELQDFASALNTHGQRCIRPRVSLAELPFETQPVPWTDRGRFLIDNQTRPGGYLHFAAGDYAIQDAASLLPITLMQLQPDQHVIDCCAAPGGKSAAILEQLDGSGLLISNEVISSRIDTLQLTLARTGYWNYMLAHHNVERLADGLSEQFDCVLVDAPCSGQSLVGRGKQSMSAFSEHQVAHSAARQQTILESAVQLVRPGGRLVYSTCTFAFAENEGIVSWLREMLPHWQPVIMPELAAWQTPGYPGCYRLWPHRDRCAGGFAAAFMRPESDSQPPLIQAVASPASRNPSSHRHAKSWSATADLTIFDEWGCIVDASLFYAHKQQIAAFDSRMPSDWQALAHCGIEAATRFGEHWQPAYPLAVLNQSTTTPFVPHRVTQLSDQEAITYLSGTSVHRAGVAGWQVVTWRDRPLGWAKQVGGQLKNHLPKPLRQPNIVCP